MSICFNCKNLWDCQISPIHYADGRVSCADFEQYDPQDEIEDLMDASASPCATCEVVAAESCAGCGLDANENESRRAAAERGIL